MTELNALIRAGLTLPEVITTFAALQSPEQNAYRAGVRAREGELEVDDDALVSQGEGGAYVMTWSWVPDSALA